jgi:hypothetical protein
MNRAILIQDDDNCNCTLYVFTQEESYNEKKKFIENFKNVKIFDFPDNVTYEEITLEIFAAI